MLDCNTFSQTRILEHQKNLPVFDAPPRELPPVYYEHGTRGPLHHGDRSDFAQAASRRGEVIVLD
jgi:hypothetical protein